MKKSLSKTPSPPSNSRKRKVPDSPEEEEEERPAKKRRSSPNNNNNKATKLYKFFEAVKNGDLGLSLSFFSAPLSFPYLCLLLADQTKSLTSLRRKLMSTPFSSSLTKNLLATLLSL
jgi:hypothetical protein